MNRCPVVNFHRFLLKLVVKQKKVLSLKKSREQFTRDEDILLIQSWLNVSKDPIVGVDQMAESFWDQGTTFNLEYAWRLLKDEPKWMGKSIGSSSKITKTSASGASSENPNTPSSYEFNSSSPMECPMRQKAAKRKGKANEIPTAKKDERNKRTTIMERLAQCKEDEIEVKVIQIMMKDTSTMSNSQRDIHEKHCREEGHNRLFNDYFSEIPVYTDVQFRRRFRMHRHVFLRIVDALGNNDEYFQMRVDATGKMGLSPLQKCTYAIRMLAYESHADSVDEYVRIGESTSIECLQRFVQGVNVVFGAEYLRKPNNTYVEHLLQMGESRGFPGMLGSIDCMHWEWKNCPIAWKGQYCRGDHGKPTIMLEAVASQDLWILHAFFGIAGHAPNVQYTINGTSYNMGYYLAYGIYLEWATFIKTISMPQGENKKLFAQHQESARKDVERAFGVLQSRFAIIRGPARAWHMETLKYTIYACIILHNMIVEDERHTYGGDFDYSYDNVDNNNSTTEIFSGPHPNLETRRKRRASIREKQVHRQLQGDLVEYVWERFGLEDDEI
ncbi:uncharacterized protein LOC131635064 [Vicia villosa]|uniref:uncharacterized protein LOC131635064 n=1 Tax=Vicia villosa TaxID=3911 RepID=UPI00273B27BB|nr:uncharacterized protein LOC131635064 [Vicia villosa]